MGKICPWWEEGTSPPPPALTVWILQAQARKEKDLLFVSMCCCFPGKPNHQSHSRAAHEKTKLLVFNYKLIHPAVSGLGAHRAGGVQ